MTAITDAPNITAEQMAYHRKVQADFDAVRPSEAPEGGAIDGSKNDEAQRGFVTPKLATKRRKDS